MSPEQAGGLCLLAIYRFRPFVLYLLNKFDNQMTYVKPVRRKRRKSRISRVIGH